MVVEEALAAVEGAVGVVPGGEGEESPRTKMYAPIIIFINLYDVMSL